MRYYSIQIDGGKTYTSHPSGAYGAADLGALLVEMDLFVNSFATASINSYVRIWGIPIQDIGQANQLSLKRIRVFGGMGRGLPLANPVQSGLLVDGSIIQPYGNWVGTDMTLDLNITAPQQLDLQTLETPQNFSFVWRKNTPVNQLIDFVLGQAYPRYSRTIRIRGGLTTDHDETGYFTTLEQFATWLKTITKAIVGKNYAGVEIKLAGTTFTVYDFSTQDNPKAIAFNDLIGQPTWLEVYVVSVPLVMRSDINPGDFITLPKTQVTVTQAAAQSALSKVRQSSIFQGTFQVLTVRHVGNSRQPDGRAWTTILNCAATGKGGALGSPADAPATSAAGTPPGFAGKDQPWS